MTTRSGAKRVAGDKGVNVVWVLCDELRTDALECYGNRDGHMATPAFDKLAEQGSRFTNMFVNSPVCVPSRTAMLTGVPPVRTGVYHNEACWPGYRFDASELTTLPQVFGEAGYATATFGKTHVPSGLAKWGTECSNGARMAELRGGLCDDDPEMVTVPGTGGVHAGVYPAGLQYPAEQVTSGALRWLDDAPEPFLLRISYLQPHTPVVVPRSHSGIYAGVEFEADEIPQARLSAFERRFAQVSGGLALSERDRHRTRSSYYALVAWVDTQLGCILDHLSRKGMASRTVVVVTADHGAYLGEGGAYGKQTFAPQCHRVPFIVRWPGSVEAGAVREDLAQGLDLGRTLFALAGLDAPEQFEGRNLFAGPSPEHIFGIIGYGATGSRAFPNLGIGTYLNECGWPRRACVRSHGYRLDRNVRLDDNEVEGSDERADVFLADLEADPAELRNVADLPAYAAARAGLEEALVAHLEGARETASHDVQRQCVTGGSNDHDTF